MRHAAQRPFPKNTTKRGFFGAFNRGFARVTERYSLLNSKLVARAGRFMLVYAGLVAMLGYFYLRLPEAFVPAEDLGYMVVDVQLPPGASRVRTDARRELERFLKSREAVASVFLISGFSFPARATMPRWPSASGLVRARRRAVGRRRDRRAERAFRAARRWHGHGRVAATDQRSG